ncbi:C45 family autoproteolytic acyltransferase/hydolase [soil metagenome]
MLQLNFNSVSETEPGEKWLSLFNTHWPAYRAWFVSKGAATHPDLSTSVDMLQKYMPELMPLYKKLCNLTGNNEIANRFLTGYQPPAYISACSQVVWKEEPMLVRNYDYHPHLSEGTLLHSAWNGRQVIATGDCLWGVVDGMNEDGLVASLTFGGRKAVGKGFGIPVILRYVLEFCSNVQEAVDALKRIPSHMAYNIMVLDKTGAYKMVQLSPDRTPVVTDALVSTNHQGVIDWPEHASFSKTVEREKFILDELKTKGQDAEGIASSFLQSPLYNRQYNDGFGTIYTAVYKPALGAMELRWPDETMLQSFSNFIETKVTITYTEKVPVQAPVYQVPQYADGEYASNADADYWVEYGKSWATGKPVQLSMQVAKQIAGAIGLSAGEETDKLLEKFISENKRRGQIPWEMLADVWSSLYKTA